MPIACARLTASPQWEPGVVPFSAARSVKSLNRDRVPSDSHRADEAGDEVQWIAAVTAPDQLTAEMWQQIMLQESIPSMLDPHDTISFLGVSATPVRLLVPLEMMARAKEVLADIQGSPSIPEAGDA